GLNPPDAVSGKCISARLNSVSGRLEYRREDCNQEKPILCYAFGKFRLARNVTRGGEQLANVKFKDALNRCAAMVREVTSVSQLNTYLGRAISAPISNGNYEFINLATQ